MLRTLDTAGPVTHSLAMKVDDLIPTVFRDTEDLRKALGVTRAAVSQWRLAGKMPVRRVLEVQDWCRKKRRKIPA